MRIKGDNKMISAVVLINTNIDAQKQVAERLRLIKGVTEAYALYDVYDILVKIRASSIDELKTVTNAHIRSLSGVTNSLILMIVDTQFPLGVHHVSGREQPLIC